MSRYNFCGTKNDRGISLIEVTILIVAIAIVAAAAMQSLVPGLKSSRQRKTEREMEALQYAIAGNPSVMSVAGGIRSDFGYVGDVGSFPPNLEALVTNPGSYATWDGPYLPPESFDDPEGFKTDEWGKPYSYNGGLDLTSTGSGSTIHKGGNDSSDDYLLNAVNGRVLDRLGSVPGATWMDEVEIKITIPDGLGGLVTKTYYPSSSGEFMMDSIPIGRHLVKAIYTPEVDTLIRYVHVLPRHAESKVLRFNFAESYFSGETGGETMLTLVENSEQIFGSGSNCNSISFDISNNTGEDVTVSSVTLTWSTPTAYYQQVRWESTVVWSSSPTRNGSGQVATFNSAQTITDGSTVTISFEEFMTSSSGSSRSNMSETTFTVLFSDGSTFNVTVPTCP